MDFIGDHAFCNCDRLKSINIPSSVKEIEESLFTYSGLISIEIPNGVTTIGKNAFEFCEKLETVIIPESVKNFGQYVFLGCPKLTVYVSNQEQFDAVHKLISGYGNIQMIQDKPVQTESLCHGIMMEALESLLLEAMSLDDIHQKYYSDIDKSVFDKIVSADPTSKQNKKGKYTEWLLNLYKGGKLKMEDLYKATGYLRAFSDFRHRLRGVDIGQIKNLPELYDTVRPFLDNPEESTSKSDEIRKLKKGATKVYEDDRWLIVCPFTEEAACYYGKGTQWCTAATKSNNYFEDYVIDYGEGCLYINIDKKTGRKYQFCFQSEEFMNESDQNLYDSVEGKSVAELIGLSSGALSVYRSDFPDEYYYKVAYAADADIIEFESKGLVFIGSGSTLYVEDYNKGKTTRLLTLPSDYDYRFEGKLYNAIGVCDCYHDYVDIYDIETGNLIFDNLKEDPIMKSGQMKLDFEGFDGYYVDEYMESDARFPDIVRVHLYKKGVASKDSSFAFYDLKEKKWATPIMNIPYDAATNFYVDLVPYYWIKDSSGHTVATSKRKFILKKTYRDDSYLCEITDCSSGRKKELKDVPVRFTDSHVFILPNTFNRYAICYPTLAVQDRGWYILMDDMTMAPLEDYSIQMLLKNHPVDPEHEKYLGKKH